MSGGYSVMRLMLLVLFAYGCYLLLMFVSQRFVIYPGRSIPTPPFAPLPAGAVQLWLDGGQKTEAWFLPPLAGAGRRPALLFFHGNAEVIDMLSGEVDQIRRWGFSVMLVEYPGFGRSAGRPTEATIVAAAVAAYDALVSRPEVDSRRIIAFGRSLGSGAACGLSVHRPLAGMILQAPFTSLRDFAPRFLVPPLLVRDPFDNRQVLKRYQGPVLILHGSRDDIIPVAHGRELARTAPMAELVEMDCAHNDCPPDERVYWETILRFIKSRNLGG